MYTGYQIRRYGTCKQTMTRSTLPTIAFFAFAASNAVGAEIGPADDIEAAVAALSPGEELVLRGGTYTQ